MSKAKDKEDFMRAMFPSSYPGANEPQQEFKFVEEDLIAAKEAKLAAEKAKETEIQTENSQSNKTAEKNNEPEAEVIDAPARETPTKKNNEGTKKKTAQKDDPENSQKTNHKGFYYFSWNDITIDGKFREIARREGVSMSSLVSEVIKNAVSDYEKSHGEISVRERKSRPARKNVLR